MRTVWSRGDQIHWVYRNPDCPTLVDLRPVTVIADDGRHLAVWLAPGTRVLYRSLADGRDIRALGGPLQFTAPRAQAVRTWRGGGIVAIFRPGADYSVWLFETSPGVRDSYYINIERPYVRTSGGIESEDLVLDVLADRDGRTTLKDEDELEFAREAGHFRDSQLAEIRASATRAISDVEEVRFPFGGDYVSFEPDPSWDVVPLPADATWDIEN